MTLVKHYDPARSNIPSPRFKADPHSVYRFLRVEQPVCRVNLPDKRPAGLMSRYAAASALWRDSRFVKELTNVDRHPGGKPIKMPWTPGFSRPLTRNLLDLDEPDHGRLRGLVHKAFTPKLVENMRAYAVKTTDRLLSKMKAHGEADLIHDFAIPLPVDVIAEAIGVPQADCGKFH